MRLRLRTGYNKGADILSSEIEPTLPLACGNRGGRGRGRHARRHPDSDGERGPAAV